MYRLDRLLRMLARKLSEVGPVLDLSAAVPLSSMDASAEPDGAPVPLQSDSGLH